MSWIEVRSRFPEGLEDFAVPVEAYRRHGIENTLETRDELVGCVVDVPGARETVAALEADLRDSGAIEVSVRDLPEENWDLAWRKFFKPRRVGKQFVVRPSWEEFESAPGDLVITLDPGQAFGTGDHATTRLCLELLEDAEVAGETVLDLGCGSGILSVAALLLGAKNVVAVDIDPLSVEVARENAERNGVKFEVLVGDGFRVVDPELQPKVVVSNIISAILMRLAPEARRRIPSGGRWLVSGIIEPNWEDVHEAITREGLVLETFREGEGWVAARFRQP